MKKYLYLLLFAVCSTVFAQTTGVFKGATSNDITGDLNIPSAKTLTVKPGGTISAYSGTLGVRSSGAAFDLKIYNTEVLTGNRALTLIVGNADRSITLSGSPTLADWFDQSVKTTASPTFAAVTLTSALTGANGGTGVANTGKTITLGGNLATSGAFSSTFTMTGTTTVTFPTTGTLATVAGTVSSITGTANQVIASAATGAVTLSLPQDIAATSAVTHASLSLGGASGAGFLQLANQASAPSTPTSSSRIYFDSSNRFSWIGTNGFSRTFDGTANTASRIYVLPDAAGTVALVATTVPSIAGTAGNVLVNGATTAVAGSAVTLSLPTALTSVNSITAASATDFTATAGSSGASFVLGQGVGGNATITPNGSGQVLITSAATANDLIVNSTASVASFALSKTGARFVRVQAGSGGTNIAYTSGGPFAFNTASTLNGSQIEVARFSSGSNLLIGTTTDMSGSGGLTATGDGSFGGAAVSTVRLTTIGSTADSSAFAFLARNSSSQNLLNIRNDGIVSLPMTGGGLSVSSTTIGGVGTGSVTSAGGFYFAKDSVLAGDLTVTYASAAAGTVTTRVRNTTATGVSLLTADTGAAYSNVVTGGSSYSGTKWGQNIANNSFFVGQYAALLGTDSVGQPIVFGQGTSAIAFFAATSGALNLSTTTASTSTTTGSLVNSGGFGNAGAFYNGGNASIAGALSVGTTTISEMFRAEGSTGYFSVNSNAMVLGDSGTNSYSIAVAAQFSKATTPYTLFTIGRNGGAALLMPIPVTISSGLNIGSAGLVTTPSSKLTIAPSNFSQSAWGVNGVMMRGDAITVTDSSTAGSTTVASAAFYSFGIPTLAATNALVTTTSSSTVFIAGGPVAGSNQTITDSWGLRNEGRTRLVGDTIVGNDTLSSAILRVQTGVSTTAEADLQFYAYDGSAASLFGFIGVGNNSFSGGVPYIANRMWVNGSRSAGLALIASHASGVIRFYAGGSNEWMSIGTTGIITSSSTVSGTSTTAAAILGKSMGLTENLYVGGNIVANGITTATSGLQQFTSESTGNNSLIQIKAGATSVPYLQFNQSSSTRVELGWSQANTNFYIRTNGTDAVTFNNTQVAAFAGDVTIASGKTLTLGNAFVATPQVPTGYIILKDSTGTSYKVSVNP